MKYLVMAVSFITLSIVLLGCALDRPSGAGKKLTCEEHQSMAIFLNDWAKNNFDEAYGKKKDFDGAIAQFFMIKNKAPFPYAQLFNRYQAKAQENISLAKKKGCDVSTYPMFPIEQFEVGVDSLKNEK